MTQSYIALIKAITEEVKEALDQGLLVKTKTQVTKNDKLQAVFFITIDDPDDIMGLLKVIHGTDAMSYPEENTFEAKTADGWVTRFELTTKEASHG